MARLTKAEKAHQMNLERAWGRLAHGVPINIMDIPAIWREVEADLATGTSMEAAVIKVRDKYRQDKPGGLCANRAV